MTKLSLVTPTAPTTSYDVQLSIDTLHLSAKLDDEQREYIYNRFHFNKGYRPKRHWDYSQTDTAKSLGFALHALPSNSYTYRHYDHSIQLQRQITTATHIPYSSLAEIIYNADFQINRIDFAFDFNIPTEKSLIMKHHGNVQFGTGEEYDKYDTQYLGKLKTRTPSKVACYNRNTKEANRNTDTTHEYYNRFEIRLFPKCNDESMKLHCMEDDFIIKHLSKYIIIPNIDDLPLTKPDKKKLYRIKDDYNYLKTLTPAKQKHLKAVTKAHRFPLELIYLENKDELFSFLSKPAESLQMII